MIFERAKKRFFHRGLKKHGKHIFEKNAFSDNSGTYRKWPKRYVDVLLVSLTRAVCREKWRF